MDDEPASASGPTLKIKNGVKSTLVLKADPETPFDSSEITKEDSTVYDTEVDENKISWLVAKIDYPQSSDTGDGINFLKIRLHLKSLYPIIHPIIPPPDSGTVVVTITNGPPVTDIPDVNYVNDD